MEACQILRIIAVVLSLVRSAAAFLPWSRGNRYRRMGPGYSLDGVVRGHRPAPRRHLTVGQVEGWKEAGPCVG